TPQSIKTPTFEKPTVVSPDQWLAARREFLREEKEFSRLRDRLAARRRELPWTKVATPYTFQSTDGPVTLAELFEGRRQLVVYHFMLAPGWEEGCRGCSFVSDHFDGAIPHLQARDVSFTAVSRAPLDEIVKFKTRMGWHFPWVSSNGNTFNQDFRVSFTPEEVERGEADYNFGKNRVMMEEMPGLSVFARGEDGAVYRTYSTYSRGLDLLIGTYNVLDLVPKGRDEDPEHHMNWVRLHDRYDHVAVVG
ncbi:MAG TPA: thioredoxin family protein, partial [Opitutaceae bacterium]|nr:thioredoxin family protein [Opitutaceae bacterium]